MGRGVISYEIDERSLQKAILNLKKIKTSAFPVAVKDSLTQVARDGAAELRKVGSKKLRVSKSVLKHRVFSRAATIRRPRALVVVAKRNIPVALLTGKSSTSKLGQGYFSKRARSSKLSGVSVGSGISARFYQRAFHLYRQKDTAKGARGTSVKGARKVAHVLQRTGSSRYPLRFPQIEVGKTMKPLTQPTVNRVMKRKFGYIFQNQINRRIKQYVRN